MPPKKSKGKKDTVPEEAPKELSVAKSLSEDLFDALSKPDIGITTNEASKDAEPIDVQVKPANGRGGRGKKAEKVEKEEMPVKKVAASRSRGKKATEDVEVIAKETENVESNGGVASVVEAKEDVVAKGKGGRGKRGAKVAPVVDVEENGEQKENGASEETEIQEVATKGKGRGGKKAAKINKDAAEAPKDTVPEEPVADTKAASRTGGRKKKSEEKDAAVAVPEKVIAENDKSVDDQKAETEPPKKKGRGGTKKTPAKVDENTATKDEEQPKQEVEAVKKPTKRGAKEPPKDKPEVEKIPPKRARAAKSSKIEEAPVENVETEEAVPKKRSRKEPSVEKELKPDSEKPKKGRGGKRKAEKVEEEPAVVEPKQEKEEDKVETIEATEESKKVEKPTTSRGGRKRAAPSTNKAKTTADEKVDNAKNVVDETKVVVDEDDEADGSKPSKAKNKKEAPMNTTTTIYNKADFDLPPLADGQMAADEPRFNLKIASWNVAGLRSWIKKDGLKFLEYEEPDIFCLQETKCSTDQLPEEVQRIPGYHPYWLCMPGGYAGVAIYSKIMPINVEYGIGSKEFDDVGRLITAEYEKFFLVNVYVPNSGRKLVNLDPRMKWEKLFQEFVQKLNDRKPVLICGDMNVSHQEIDLANPKSNARNAGFTKEERNKMSELLALGYVDTFRHLYPERKAAYTFWTYMANSRSRNVGWRLDYFIVSERFIKRVVDNCIRSQCMGSDHCPITLFLKL